MRYKIKGLRIAILLVGIAGAILFGKHVFKDEIVVTKIDVSKPEVSQEDILVDQGEVTINSFQEGVKDIKWIDEENLLLEGKLYQGNLNTFSFNVNRNLLEKFEGNNDDLLEKLPEAALDYNYISQLNDNHVLLSPNKPEDQVYGLLVMDMTGDISWLTEDCKFEGDAKYKYSENREKVVYYDKDDHKIKTFGIRSDRVRALKETFPDEIIRSFHDTIQQPKTGGYVMVVYDPVYYKNKGSYTVEDISFSVFGADTGRFYGDRVLGINPSWSDDGTKIAYLYGPESDILFDGHHEERVVVAKRVGILKCSSEAFTYLDSPLNSKMAINELVWSNTDNNLIYMAGEFQDDGQLKIDSILNYNYLKKMFVNNENTINHMITESTSYNLYVVDKYIGVVKQDQESVTFNLFDEYSNFIVENKNLKSFKVGYNNQDIYYYNNGMQFMTFDGSRLMVRSDAEENYISILEGKPFRLFPSNYSQSLCVEYYEDRTLKVINY